MSPNRDGKRKWRKIQLRYTDRTAARILGEAGGVLGKELNFWYDQKEKDGSLILLSRKKSKKFMRNWNQIMFFGAIARAVKVDVPEGPCEEEKS